MLDGLFIMSLIGTAIGFVKEGFQHSNIAREWDRKVWREDIIRGASVEEQQYNIENGLYIKETHIEPHRDCDGNIVIENAQLYYNDLMYYNPSQVYEWVEQGKYNLNEEELEKERKRIEEKYKRILSY